MSSLYIQPQTQWSWCERTNKKKSHSFVDRLCNVLSANSMNVNFLFQIQIFHWIQNRLIKSDCLTECENNNTIRGRRLSSSAWLTFPMLDRVWKTFFGNWIAVHSRNHTSYPMYTTITERNQWVAPGKFVLLAIVPWYKMYTNKKHTLEWTRMQQIMRNLTNESIFFPSIKNHALEYAMHQPWTGESPHAVNGNNSRTLQTTTTKLNVCVYVVEMQWSRTLHATVGRRYFVTPQPCLRSVYRPIIPFLFLCLSESFCSPCFVYHMSNPIRELLLLISRTHTSCTLIYIYWWI